MKDSRIEIAEEFLITQMNHWPLFTLAVMVLGIWDAPKPVMWAWVLCGLLPFAMYFVRLLVDSRILFLAFHILAGALFWLLPLDDTLQLVLLRFAVVCYLLRSCYLRFRSRDSSQKDTAMFPGLAIGIIAAAVFLTNQNQPSGWNAYFIFSAIACLGFYFLQTFLQHYVRFLEVNESSTGHIPSGEIFRCGWKLAVLYTAAGVLFLLAVSGFSLPAGVGGRVKDALMWLLRKLFSWISLKPGQAGEETAEQFVPGQMMPAPESGSPSMFLVWLQKIVFFALSLLIMAALAAGIVFFLYSVIRRFRGRAKEKKVPLEEAADVREKCGKEELIKGKRIPFFLLSPRERIRKIFKKRVLEEKSRILGSKKGSRLEIFTARECAQRLSQETLGIIYEKARYSEEECTTEDIKALKGNR